MNDSGDMRDLRDWHGKRLTVVGAGVSGRELALLAARLGAGVFVTDQKEISAEAKELFLENGIAWEEGGHTAHAYRSDAMLLSSGIPPSAQVVQEAGWRGMPVLGETSGGGTCAVTKHATPDGFIYQISSGLCRFVDDEGNTCDQGVSVDIPLTDGSGYKGFYDIDAISRAMNAFYVAAEDD